MEQPEVPLEKTQEDIHHHALASGESWILGVALTSALFAALAAISSLLAGHYANEAMISRIEASDQWNYYQAKSIKSSLISVKIDLLKSLRQPADDASRQKLVEYKGDLEQIKADAEKREQESQEDLGRHVLFSRGVTLFQIAIAVSAISILVRRRSFWLLSIGFGSAASVFLMRGLLLLR